MMVMTIRRLWMGVVVVVVVVMMMMSSTNSSSARDREMHGMFMIEVLLIPY